jgi:hypothetical protein
MIQMMLLIQSSLWKTMMLLMNWPIYLLPASVAMPASRKNGSAGFHVAQAMGMRQCIQVATEGAKQCRENEMPHKDGDYCVIVY